MGKHVYVITVKARKYRYATLDEARSVADRIFQRTRVVVGIELELVK